MNIKELFESVNGDTGRIAVNEASGTISITIPKGKPEVYKFTGTTEKVVVDGAETEQKLVTKVSTVSVD